MGDAGNTIISGQNFSLVGDRSGISLYGAGLRKSGLYVQRTNLVLEGLRKEQLQETVIASDNSRIFSYEDLSGITEYNTAEYNFPGSQTPPPITGLPDLSLIKIQVTPLSDPRLWSPRLDNNGSRFFWNPDSPVLRNADFEQFTIELTVNNVKKAEAQLKAMNKDLLGKKLRIILPGSGNNHDFLQNSIVISGFYNGTVQFSSGYLDNLSAMFKDIQRLEIENVHMHNTGIRLENIQLFNVDRSDFTCGSDSVYQQNPYQEIQAGEDWPSRPVDFLAMKAGSDRLESMLKIRNSQGAVRRCYFGNSGAAAIQALLNTRLTASGNIFAFSMARQFLSMHSPACYLACMCSEIMAADDLIYLFTQSIDIKYRHLPTAMNPNYNVLSGNLQDFWRNPVIAQNPGDDRTISGTICKFPNYDSCKRFFGLDDQYDETKFTLADYLMIFGFIYGFAYPGSIFNHLHKRHFLKNSQHGRSRLEWTSGGERIKNEIPSGALYLVPQSISENIRHNEKYAETQTLGMLETGQRFPAGASFNFEWRSFDEDTSYQTVMKSLPSPSDWIKTALWQTADKNSNLDQRQALCQDLPFLSVFGNHFDRGASPLYTGQTSGSVKTGVPQQYAEKQCRGFTEVLQFSEYTQTGQQLFKDRALIGWEASL